jgi:fructose-specific component phosphotransferase system IIB-like protein
MPSARVLLIGLDPAVVDYAKLPGLTHDILRAAIDAAEVSVIERGYEAELCLVDHGAAAEKVVTQALSDASFDCVLIGAGIRVSQDHLLLFEKLINVVHRLAPKARICFNTSPADTAAAVARWV